MNKTEILNIVNEPSKHIHIVKIDGKDEIVYSSKFLELLELIPTMLTKDDIVTMLEDLLMEIFKESWRLECICDDLDGSAVDWDDIRKVIQQKINSLKEEESK